MAGVDQVNIDEVCCDRCCQVIGVGLLVEVGLRNRRNHWRIVGAGDGDVDLAGDDAALLVVEGDSEAFGSGFVEL